MNYDLPPPPASVGVSNVADLAYRNYEGPLISRTLRWWIIAKSGIQNTMKKPGFWVAVAFCLLPYLIHFAIYFFTQQLTQQATDAGVGAAGVLGGSDPQRYGQLVYTCLCSDTNLLSTFVIALLIGTGSIAADNRANALMVYLSKPITKGDYLLGKWVGVFLTLWMVALVPCLLLFLLMMVVYTTDGFLKENPTLILRLLAASLVPALVHTSVLIGLSAWSKSPRLVGSIYAGIYFVGGILARVLGNTLYANDPDLNNMVQHFSLSGVIEGIIQNLLHITVAPIFLQRRDDPSLGIPIVTPLAIAAVVMIIGGVLAARTKINAVEVIRG